MDTTGNMQIKFYEIAHLYLGCDVKCQPKPYEEQSISGKLYGVVMNTAFVQCFDVYGRPWTSPHGAFHLEKLTFNLIKPILRPLSDMTEEEKAQLRDFMGWARYVEYLKFGLCTPEGVAYLLKQGFDLFNLIESGQAIDRTTPQPAQ